MQHLASADEAVAWLRARVAQNPGGALRSDSRQVQPGDVFVAWPGAASDGRLHVQAALNSGAAACLVEAQAVQAFAFADARIAALPGLKAATGAIAHAWAGAPSAHLQVLAVTGTNGKTSTSWWLAQALSSLGQRCGVAGTLGVGEPVFESGGMAAEQVVAQTSVRSTGLTTPDPVTLHSSLGLMLASGVRACAIEASSIGLQEHRLDALHIAVALFTNFTQDHLDYHGSMAAYWAAKRRLFSWPGLRAAVVHVGDAQGALLAQELQAFGLNLWTVAVEGDGRAGASAPPVTGARLLGRRLRYEAGLMVLDVHEGAQSVTVRCPLVGRFNAENLLVVLGGLRALGVSLPYACQAASQLRPVAGRMQRVDAEKAAGGADVEVIVDYAHTPDALHQVLQALAPLAAARAGRLWCVVGCGGDRDASKRPLMGAAALQGADAVVFTSDNPRSENPAAIVQQMLVGATGSPGWQQRVAVLEDRRAAIEHAVLQAAPGDVVLVAGKGHELTQEVSGVFLPFSDLDVARHALVLRAARNASAAACIGPTEALAC